MSADSSLQRVLMSDGSPDRYFVSWVSRYCDFDFLTYINSYGETARAYPSQASYEGWHGCINTALMTDVHHSSVASYQIINSHGSSEPTTVRSVPPPGSSDPLLVAVISNITANSQILGTLAQSDVHLILSIGDLIFENTTPDEWNHIGSLLDPVLKNTPFIAAIGDYELSSDFDALPFRCVFVYLTATNMLRHIRFP
eukprot:TRINITY_DN19547_c0_g1_i1.p1 TRINITY_DN19547_c0_g1~~TRINITY_DN19547_c0_g1_i1.p1  ORF type:complete len:221 (+),score=23.09 TRINITY_DN19547_c0_g1_i1:71-664(+)